MVPPTPEAEVTGLGIHSYPGQHSVSPYQREKEKKSWRDLIQLDWTLMECLFHAQHKGALTAR